MLVIHIRTDRFNNRKSAFFDVMYLCVLKESQNKERLLPLSTLTNWILNSIRCVCIVGMKCTVICTGNLFVFELLKQKN
jgi:hypothetical protein